MLSSVCAIPATPLLVPQVGGSAAGETAGLRSSVLAAVGEMAAGADRWLVLGAGEQGDGLDPAAIGAYEPRPALGTFAGFGPDVRVWIGPDGDDGRGRDGRDFRDGSAAADAGMPLPLLIAGWLRGRLPASARHAGPIRGVRVGTSAAPRECARFGRALRAELDAESPRTAVLVVGDGPSTLTAKAPGAYRPEAPAIAETVAAAVAAADGAAFAALDPASCADSGVNGRAPWQVAAALVEGGPVRVSHACCEAPYGVAYYCGLWVPAGTAAR